MKRFVHDSNTMLRDLPVLDEHGRAQEPVDVVFLKSVFQEFKTAIDSALLDGVEEHHERSQWNIGGSISIAQSRAESLLLEVIPFEQSRWSAHRRVIQALREGIKDGVIRFESEEDVDLFSHILRADFVFFPALVERYVRTGEFAEVLQRVVDSKNFILDHGAFRVQLFRLYTFDVFKEQEHMESGSEEEFVPLPLEIRLNFSGFDEDVSRGESRWDSERTHPLATEESIFSSFQETRQKIEEARDRSESSGAR